MSDIAIRVEGLGKRYRLGAKQQPYYSLRDTLSGIGQVPLQAARRLVGRGPSTVSRARDFWALKDVCFEVKKGESLGIIGRNGAGKSTLLKLLSEITEPTAGTISIEGRVASLLEVGTGFHPELTGRENIFLNGAILGMGKQEISGKFDEIVAFAEVEKFIDTQVKFYSSGMYLRLAFAVAAHLEPEVLIVDEVLAVGDQAFQQKCLGKMREVTRGGRTVLLVSHQLPAVLDLCRSVVVLDRGKLAFAGPASDAISFYSDLCHVNTSIDLLGEGVHRTGSGRVRLETFHLEDDGGNVVTSARAGQPVVAVLGFAAMAEASGVSVGLSLHDEGDRAMTVFYSEYEKKVYSRLPERGRFECHIPKLALTPGRYRVGGRVLESGVEADWPRNGIGYLSVEGGDYYGKGCTEVVGGTRFFLDASWDMRPC